MTHVWLNLRTEHPWIWRFSCIYSLVGEAGTAKATMNAEKGQGVSETVAHGNRTVLREGMEK